MTMSNDAKDTTPLFDEGLQVRREVLGDSYVDAAMKPMDSLTVGFQPFMTNYCWGEIWTDETLPRRERSLLVLAMTAALGRMDEVAVHTRGALRNGVTPAELLAVLKQVTVYSGVPAGVNMLKVMREIIDGFDPNEE